MKTNDLLVLTLILITIFLCACENKSESNITSSVTTTTLKIDSLDVVISTASEMLGEPREIVNMDEDHFAVYDHAYKKIMVFDKTGDKKYEFGNTGEGPGEWDPMSGATDLSFMENKFITSNPGRLLFDAFDREGNHLWAKSFPSFMSNSSKQWMDDLNLFTSTFGRENALAVVMDMNSDGEITERIGEPATHYSKRLDLDQERNSYANGDVPESAKNEVLVAAFDRGYLLFVNSTGELKKYNEERKLLFTSQIPKDVKDQIFNYVVSKNKEIQSPGVVFPLEYAKSIEVKNDLTYVFMPKIGIEGNLPESRIIVFDLNGDLKNQYVFTDQTNTSFLYDMAIDDKNMIYLIDIMNARVLSFDPEIEA